MSFKDLRARAAVALKSKPVETSTGASKTETSQADAKQATLNPRPPGKPARMGSSSRKITAATNANVGGDRADARPDPKDYSSILRALQRPGF